MIEEKLYPLKFAPILKTKIWGGEKLHSVLGKEKIGNKIGESWEISGVDGDFSVVENGSLRGKSLKNLILKYKEKLVGTSIYARYKENFPLLVKFIDAKENLSVQVHPDDELASKRHDTLGKTEMWYIVQADPEAKIITGFQNGITKEGYLSHLKNESLEEILNKEVVESGDAFYIKAGLIHAIGAGVLLAEIQETSDITYRIYDYNRKGIDGEKRELHTQLALDAIDYSNNDDYKIRYNSKENKLNSLVDCAYFTTQLLHLKEDYSFNLPIHSDSFVILMCVEGSAVIEYEDGNENIKLGECMLIPADLKELNISSNNCKLLHVTI
ncbi:type I phosphomannose isomerase catalytic subunit [Mesonia ostreae]|uniref:Phosphohexomutase n=1 Tax=Mesonia ostreae TaxID=861110 RepID=A0ABU2KM69_9FLAO|nr:type I phosphomannose isomerase catalytic subunit [Mesonia ostreae]MDT0295811.1 mannose-6-phosphate isomerase [Mesonia ostreae]